MRHLILLFLFLLLCLTVLFILPEDSPIQAVPAVAADSDFGLESLRMEKMVLQPLPERLLIVDVAADSCSNATELVLNDSGVGETTVVNSMTEGAEDPVLSCAWGNLSRPQGYRTVWYKFTPSSNGRVAIDSSNNFNPNS